MPEPPQRIYNFQPLPKKGALIEEPAKRYALTSYWSIEDNQAMIDALQLEADFANIQLRQLRQHKGMINSSDVIGEIKKVAKASGAELPSALVYDFLLDNSEMKALPEPEQTKFTSADLDRIANQNTILETLYRRLNNLEEVAHVTQVPVLLFSNFELEDIREFARGRGRYEGLADEPYLGADFYLRKTNVHVPFLGNYDHFKTENFEAYSIESINKILEDIGKPHSENPPTNFGILDLLVIKQLLQNEKYREQLLVKN